MTKNIDSYMNAKSRQVKASIVTDILESVRNQSDQTAGGFVKKVCDMLLVVDGMRFTQKLTCTPRVLCSSLSSIFIRTF